jgi:hypothetical protein
VSNDFWVRESDKEWEVGGRFKNIDEVRLHVRTTGQPVHVWPAPNVYSPDTLPSLQNGECLSFDDCTSPMGSEDACLVSYQQPDLIIKGDEIIDHCAKCGRQTQMSPRLSDPQIETTATVVFLCLHDDNHWIRKIYYTTSAHQA